MYISACIDPNIYKLMGDDENVIDTFIISNDDFDKTENEKLEIVLSKVYEKYPNFKSTFIDSIPILIIGIDNKLHIKENNNAN